MQQSSNLEVPLRVIGPDNTVLWEGSGWLGVVQVGKASVAITTGMSLQLSPATFILQADDLLATAVPVANVLSVNPAPAAGAGVPTGLIGVALAPAAINAIVPIAKAGSIVPALTGAVLQTLGNHCIHAAGGALAASSTVAPINPQQSIGYVTKPRGVVGGATDTGTADRCGVLVVVHSG